jgi:hypothetical protein
MQRGMLTNVIMQRWKDAGARRQQNEGKATHGRCGLGMRRRARDFLKMWIADAC